MNTSQLLFPYFNLITDEGTVGTADFSDHRITVVVPAYNEERFIGSVVLKLLRYSVKVIVVDDGSTDATSEIAVRAGAWVIRFEKNQGKGAAINAGFANARALNPDVIVLIDGDGQHLPEELPCVVRPILDGQADIVIGSRYLQRMHGDGSEHACQVPRHRVFGHWVFNRITQLASGVGVTDSQSGYRAFSPRAAETISFQSNGFSVESEMQFIARENHLKLLDVPITIRYQDPPKRSVIAQGLNVLNGILHLVGQYRPLLFFGVPGLVLLLAGLGWGVWVTQIYARTHDLATGYAMVCVLMTVIGVLMLSTGLILHSIRGLLVSLLPQGH